MKYSLVNGVKSEAFPKGRGICVCCNMETIAKCGNRIVHHWAHRSLKHCDNWWENETEWHRNWKDHFPKEWQEVVHFDEETNEKHIADVKTDKGVIIEFQNSPISTDEIIARENFYKDLIWIVNGLHFKKSFFILDKLPNPNAEFMQDIVFTPRKKSQKGKLFWRISENSDYGPDSMVWVHGRDEIKEEIEEHYIGHHFYDWVRPRKYWYDAKCTLLIDFGDDFLWKLQHSYHGEEKDTYVGGGPGCILRILKSDFIKQHNKL